MIEKTQKDILTYEEMFKKLKEDLVSKAQIHFKMENDISKSEFIDSDSMDSYLRTEDEWQKASKTYAGFLANISDKEFKPNDVVAFF